MAFDTIYGDAEAVGEYVYDANRLKRRRANISESFARQLEADKENARLALGYENLYRQLESRAADRDFQADENQKGRDASEASQKRGFDHAREMAGLNFDLHEKSADAAAKRSDELAVKASERALDNATALAEVNTANDLERIGAQSSAHQANVEHELTFRQKQEIDRLKGALTALESDPRWDHDDPLYHQERQRILNAIGGIKSSAMPTEVRPTLSETMKPGGEFVAHFDGVGTFIKDPSNPDAPVQFRPAEPTKPPMSLSDYASLVTGVQAMFTRTEKGANGQTTETVDTAAAEAFMQKLLQGYFSTLGATPRGAASMQAPGTPSGQQPQQQPAAPSQQPAPQSPPPSRTAVRPTPPGSVGNYDEHGIMRIQRWTNDGTPVNKRGQAWSVGSNAPNFDKTWYQLEEGQQIATNGKFVDPDGHKPGGLYSPHKVTPANVVTEIAKHPAGQWFKVEGIDATVRVDGDGDLEVWGAGGNKEANSAALINTMRRALAKPGEDVPPLGLPRPATQAEYDALPPGTAYWHTKLKRQQVKK
jgi:hypothetical protein